jgi:hypothetical protein
MFPLAKFGGYKPDPARSAQILSCQEAKMISFLIQRPSSLKRHATDFMEAEGALGLISCRPWWPPKGSCSG